MLRSSLKLLQGSDIWASNARKSGGLMKGREAYRKTDAMPPPAPAQPQTPSIGESSTFGGRTSRHLSLNKQCRKTTSLRKGIKRGSEPVLTAKRGLRSGLWLGLHVLDGIPATA